MELHKLTAEEIRGLDAAKLREVEGDIRKQLVGIRMDIYTAKSAHASKIKGMRKSLARVLTVTTEQAAKRTLGSDAVKAPKVAKAKATTSAAKTKTKNQSATKK